MDRKCSGIDWDAAQAGARVLACGYPGALHGGQPRCEPGWRRGRHRQPPTIVGSVCHSQPRLKGMGWDGEESQWERQEFQGKGV